MLRRLLIAGPFALVGAAWCYWLILPWPLWLPWRDPSSTAFIDMRRSEARAAGEPLEIRQIWVPLSRISSQLQRAVVVAEDGRFREHHGIDWQALGEELGYRADADFSLLDARDRRALRNAIGYYLRNRSKVRGRSTITQQLAKNLYFSSSRSVTRKVEELIVAKRLEWLLSKDRILEIYLNVAEWGPGLFGAEAAARHYFAVPATQLSADQAAALAATLPHPLTSNPRTRPGRMAWRKEIILRRMGQSGPVRTVPLEPPGAIRLDTTAAFASPVRRPADSSATTSSDTVVRSDTLRRDTTPGDATAAMRPSPASPGSPGFRPLTAR